MSELNLDKATAARDAGIGSVIDNNRDFVKTMRGVARMIARKKGYVTADDLRDYADKNGLKPTHHNVYGGIFCTKDFVAGDYTVSEQVQGHGNRIRKWTLR